MTELSKEDMVNHHFLKRLEAEAEVRELREVLEKEHSPLCSALGPVAGCYICTPAEKEKE